MPGRRPTIGAQRVNWGPQTTVTIRRPERSPKTHGLFRRAFARLDEYTFP